MASKKAERPKADLVMRDDEFMPRSFRCPSCGSTEWSPGSYFYEPGKCEITYTCWHESRGRQCGFKVRTTEDQPDLIWVSPNQQWLIYRSEPRFAPDLDEPYSTATVVSISDGWNSGDVSINVGGKVTYDEWALYSVPQYVRDRAESILNRSWKGIVKGNGPSNHRFVVIPFRPGQYTMVSGDATAYDTKKKAMDAGRKLFDSMPESEKEAGAGVTIGETNDWNGTQKFSYNHIYEFSYREHPDLRPKRASQSRKASANKSDPSGYKLLWTSENGKWRYYEGAIVPYNPNDRSAMVASVRVVGPDYDTVVGIDGTGRITDYGRGTVPKYVMSKITTSLQFRLDRERMRAKPKTSPNRKPKKKVSRSSKQLPGPSDYMRLVMDFTSFTYDYDPYEFKDAYDSIDDAIDEDAASLRTKSGLDWAIEWLDDEVGPIDYDNDLEQRRKNLLVRLNRLRDETILAGKKSSGQLKPKGGQKPKAPQKASSNRKTSRSAPRKKKAGSGKSGGRR